MAETLLDCLIVGGGPAGLAAALYLARFRRRALIVDGGASRARWIPSTRNYPGFPDGVSGRALLAHIRAQAECFGAIVKAGTVAGIEAADDGFVAWTPVRAYKTKTVLIATGVADVLPAVPGWSEDAIVAGLVRLCPICDGFEVIGRRIAVWGTPEKAVREALFLRTYTADVTAIIAGAGDISAKDRALLAEGGVALETAPVRRLTRREAGIGLSFGDGDERSFDALYLAMGAPPRSNLATALGAEASASGCLIVDAHQRTSVPNLYAGGDVVHELNQISVATGHAAIAATAIHNSL